MTNKSSEFERIAGSDSGASFVGELWGLMSANKKWWLLPIMLMMLIFGIITVLSTTAAAPFIYTLF